MSDVDYEKIGLKVGLEIHQQLATSAKLFCECKPELFKDEPEVTFLRRLRPTQSELGQVDPAAFFEFQKGRKVLYEANRASSCLVEMDEEPPHPLNREAVETAMTVSLLIGARPVDEVHVMRKTVIDGSNTTGFQRTCVIALGGQIMVGDKLVPIQHASLEEDAARKMSEEEGNVVRYRIDRLGIPLIEVATAPVIYSPGEAEKVAFGIGRILRATGRVMRGLGTIRQDINISIPDGALVEIKGVQELDLVSLAVEYEVQRQLRLIEICKDLKKRDVKQEDVIEKFVDVSEVFSRTKCKVIQKALGKKQVAMAVKLCGFVGFLKRELLPGFRLGTEIADRARFWGRVGGIFHSDEMPAYGVSVQEVAALRKAVDADDDDAVVFVADNADNATDALRAVVDRAKEVLLRVPEETRAANPDGTSRYMRPRPGAARMYPETDIPPLEISDEYVEEIRSRLPELPERKLGRLMKEQGLNEKLARQVLDSEYSESFENIVAESGASATVVAAFLTETLTALRRDGVKIDAVAEDGIRGIFGLVGSGVLAKEAVPDVFVWLSKHKGKSVEDAVEGLGLKCLSGSELQSLIDKVVEENEELVKVKGEGSFGVLMSAVMKSCRGRVDAADVSKLLKEKLEKAKV
jgi:glutamyl-tRNA(Gln) amidotransferase subunit E